MIDHLTSKKQATIMNLNWVCGLSSKTLLDRLVIFLGLIIMGFAGFGNRNVYEATAAICSGLVVWITLRERNPVVTIGICGLALTGVFFPSVYRLYGFWTLLLSSNPSTLPLTLFPVSSWFLSFVDVPLAICLVTPMVASICILPIRTLTLRAMLSFLLFALVSITLHQLLAPQPKFVVKEESTFSYGYKIGAALQKSFPDTFGDGAVIRSNIHGTKIPPSTPGIVIAEHDTPPELLAGRIKPENFTQPTPWSNNEFLGNQYWRYAIRKDGLLVSNLGGQLTSTGRIFLALPSPNPFYPAILATQLGKTLYCSDSDYWINRLCNYQKNLIGVILSEKKTIWVPYVVNIICILVAIFSLWRSWITICGILILIPLALGNTSRDGDIRLIGPSYNPHDPARAWAVARRLQDDGINATIGDKRAKAIVIEEGYSANIGGEKLVIAEPRSTAKIGSHTIQVQDVPLGVVDSIPDARNLIIDGRPSGAKSVVDGVTIIGTGSPALTPSDLWFILRE